MKSDKQMPEPRVKKSETIDELMLVCQKIKDLDALRRSAMQQSSTLKPAA